MLVMQAQHSCQGLEVRLWHLCITHSRNHRGHQESNTHEGPTNAVLEKASPKRKSDALLKNSAYTQILRDDVERAENQERGKRRKTEPDPTVLELGNMQSIPVP